MSLPGAAANNRITVAVADGDARGTIVVTPEVLIELIDLAIAESGLPVRVAPSRRRPTRSLDLAGSQGDTDGGPWSRGRGIRVRTDGTVVDARIDLVATGLASLAAMAEQLQDLLSVMIGRVLGLKTGTLHIHVVDIDEQGTHTT